MGSALGVPTHRITDEEHLEQIQELLRAILVEVKTLNRNLEFVMGVPSEAGQDVIDP